MPACPLVSVGIPVYNGAASIRGALESVLGQTYAHIEVVVCDNGSTDGTEDICRQYAAIDGRVRYIRNERNIGALPNFMRVLELSHGTYFAWNAADDVRPVEAIAACVSALERFPQAVMAHGPVHARLAAPPRTVEVDNRMDLSEASADCRIRAFTRGLEHNGMLYGLYRRKFLATARLRRHFGHDYLFCLKMCLLGPIAYTSVPIIGYQHRNDAVVGPMYARLAPTLKDLLFYRGVRRSKCWTTLFLGCSYLMAEPSVPMKAKIRATAAHVQGFTSRYAGHLASETVFVLFWPFFRVLGPFAPLLIRANAELKRRGLFGGVSKNADSHL